jgi:acyl-CoA reductase-like NAD-dependent aldehyde dehydrogenase
VNQIILDSVRDMKAVARNIAFSLSLYTGQMCTAPQNIYVPREGIDTSEGHLSFDQVAEALADGVRKLLADPARAVEVLGAVQNDGVLRRLEAARSLGTLVLDTQAIAHPRFRRRRCARRSSSSSGPKTARPTSTNGSAPSRS